MDNHRFNVTGDKLNHLVAILEFIFKREFNWPTPHPKNSEGYGGFTGYRLDPFLGLVLYRYPIEHDDKLTQKFPFQEGHDPIRLATFIQNYLKSESAKSVKNPPVPEPNKDGSAGYDRYGFIRQDLRWDGWCDHDGSNGDGWRIYTGEWGHVGEHGYRAPFAVRPIVAWYGK
jgi:hypothetical protein